MDFYWESCKMNKPISFVSHWIWHDLLRLQQKTNINIYVYDIYWFFFSTFLARIIAMQMLHDAIYHFPLTLLKQSFTIWEPLRSSGPCHRHCFPGSLGSTLLLSRSLASGWRKSECPGGCFRGTNQYPPLGQQRHASLNLDLCAPERSQDANWCAGHIHSPWMQCLRRLLWIKS